MEKLIYCFALIPVFFYSCEKLDNNLENKIDNHEYVLETRSTVEYLPSFLIRPDGSNYEISWSNEVNPQPLFSYYVFTFVVGGKSDQTFTASGYSGKIFTPITGSSGALIMTNPTTGSSKTLNFNFGNGLPSDCFCGKRYLKFGLEASSDINNLNCGFRLEGLSPAYERENHISFMAPDTYGIFRYLYTNYDGRQVWERIQSGPIQVSYGNDTRYGWVNWHSFQASKLPTHLYQLRLYSKDCPSRENHFAYIDFKFDSEKQIKCNGATDELFAFR